jgi:Arc/MetJ-type ribon-helix-helix transcriptional regulator
MSTSGSEVREVLELVQRLASLREAGEVPEIDRQTESGPDVVFVERARKVSVSLPEGLTAAVQRRVGKGEFSHYVTQAVARQLELDLLAELVEILEAEHGPVPEEFLAEARAEWPDVE